MNTGDDPTQPAIGRSFPTPLSYPLLLGHGAIRDDVAWGVLAGRIGLRYLFTPQTGELCLGGHGRNSSGSAALFGHRLCSRRFSFGYEGLDSDCGSIEHARALKMRP
jgi:hypothetical protein